MTIQTQIPALPTQVKVGAVTYPVELVADLTAVAHRDGEIGENSVLFGDINYLHPRIRLESENAQVAQVKTFLHEIMHALLLENGDDELNADETFVERTANQLAQVFVDNGWTFGASEKEYEVVASGDVAHGLPSFAQKDTYGDYRKVARIAVVGDLILTSLGDVLRVTGGLDGRDHVSLRNVPYRVGMSYVVLEPLAKGGADHATS